MVSQSSSSDAIDDRPLVVSSSALASPGSGDVPQAKDSYSTESQNNSLEASLERISLDSNGPDIPIGQNVPGSTHSATGSGSPDFAARTVNDPFTESANASSYDYAHDSSISSGPDLTLHNHMMSPSMLAAQQYISYHQPQHTRQHFANTFTVSVTNIPLSFQWKDLRDLAQSRVPNLHIIYTKLAAPGSGLLTIKGYQGAITAVQQLNGLILNSGLMLSAALFNTIAPSYLTPYGTDGTTSPPALYSPMVSPGASIPRSTSQESAGLYNGMTYPMIYDPSGYMTAQWTGAGLYGAVPHSYVSQPRRSYKSGNYPAFADKQRLFIGNIPFSTQWQELKDFLRTGGNIYRVEIPSYENGQSKGYAIATFYTEQDAANAIKTFDRSIFNGRELNVRYDKHKRYGHGSSMHDMDGFDTMSLFGQKSEPDTGDMLDTNDRPENQTTDKNREIDTSDTSNTPVVNSSEKSSENELLNESHENIASIHDSSGEKNSE